MPSVNISRTLHIYDKWFCQRWRRLQTCESLNRKKLSDWLSADIRSKEQSERAGRKLAGSSRIEGEKGWQGHGAAANLQFLQAPRTPRAGALLTQRCLQPEGNFLKQATQSGVLLAVTKAPKDEKPVRKTCLPWGGSSSASPTWHLQILTWVISGLDGVLPEVPFGSTGFLQCLRLPGYHVWSYLGPNEIRLLNICYTFPWQQEQGNL